MQENNPVTYFAETDHRKKVPFGIKAEDRTKHVYVIGKTGMGKSTLLENMAIQDIQGGNGMAFVDPHGKTAEKLLEYVPKERLDDVIYFAPFDMEHPMSFNIMEDVGYDKRHLVANGLMSAFKKIWVDAWSARMEYILNNVVLALLEYPDSTLLGVNRMLTDKGYRKAVVDNITDPSTKSFWVDEFAKYTDRYTQEATPAIQNKVGQFTANPLIRNIIGQPKSSFDLREVMDNKKILIINLSKGQIGEGNANLLGSMLITKLYLAAMSRADLNEAELNKRPNFYLFVDEFQSFANESFADILSEARKYRLNLTIAHQYIEQMPEEVRSAVFGNVGTMISFRVGAYDADVLEKEFAPKFYAEDMVNLGFAQVYLKLMIDGVSSQPFSAKTLPPIQSPEGSFSNEVTEASRRLYAKPRLEVQNSIDAWYAKDHTPEKPKKTGEGGLGKATVREVTPATHTAPRSAPRTETEQRERPRRVAPERRTTERREPTERRGAPRSAASRNNNQERLSMNDLKKQTAQKELAAEKKNVSGLKDALAQILEKEGGDTKDQAAKKPAPKPMPKPLPRKETRKEEPKQEPQQEKREAPTAASKPVSEKVEAKEKTEAVIETKSTQAVKLTETQTAETTAAPTIQPKPAKSESKPVANLHTPDNHLPRYDVDNFDPSEKTQKKAQEVPEDVLKNVLGI